MQSKQGLAVVFGCWTTVSRKSVLPVFESSTACCLPRAVEARVVEDVFYTGAAPNQQAIPVVDYLMNDIAVERLGAAGSTLRLSAHDESLLEGVLRRQGRRQAADIMINYTPFGHSDWQ